MADVDRAEYSARKKVYTKEVRNWRKIHKICVVCGHEDAQSGYLTCISCRMKNNEKCREYYRKSFSTEQRYKHDQHRKRRYDLLKAFGVCTCCGKRDVAPGKTLCAICSAKKARQQKARTISQGGWTKEMFEYSGGCYFCGEPVLKGKKVCQKHYDILSTNLKKARICLDLEHHPFRLDNEIAFGNYDRR